jgi:hypothetical protein
MLKNKNINISLDISYLKDPEYLSINLASDELKEHLENSLKKMKSMSCFSPYEYSKFERIVTWVRATEFNENIIQHRADFYRFISEFEMRYKNNFLSLFPQYKNFYNICKKSAIWTNL